MADYTGKINTQDIINIIERKKNISINDVEFLKNQIVTLDASKEPYQSALKILDTYLLNDIKILNDSLVGIQSAYQDRIDAGARTTLFWNYDGVDNMGNQLFTCIDAAKFVSGNSGIGSTVVRYTYSDGFTVGITTIFLNENGKVTDQSDLATLGMGVTALHALKIYTEPYTQDILNPLISSFPGSIGIVTSTYSAGFVTVNYSTKAVTVSGGNFITAGIKTGDIIYIGAGYTYGSATVSQVSTASSLSIASTSGLSGDPIQLQTYSILQGANFTTLNVLAPITAVTGLQTGQIIKSTNKPYVFSPRENKIIGIGTTVADLSTVYTGYSTSSVIYQLTLEDPFISPAQAPEPEILPDGSFFVEFDVLMNPNELSDSLAFDVPSRPKGDKGKPVFEKELKQPYVPQTISRYLEVNADKGVRIEYVRSFDDPSPKKWNHFLEGFQDPDQLDREVYVEEPKVGSGTLYYSIGFNRAPTDGFGNFAKEGDKIVNPIFIGLLFYDNLSNNPTLNAAINQKLNENAVLESEFQSNYSDYQQKIKASNLIRDDANELNIRIWGCRVKLGESLDTLSKYDIRLEAVIDPSVIDFTN
jgi:hypothetical protein